VVSGCWPPWYVRPVADAVGPEALRERLCYELKGCMEWPPRSAASTSAILGYARFQHQMQAILAEAAELPPEFGRRQGVPLLVLYGRLATADHPNPAPLATLGELARRKA
jgi:hypothetical protein